VILPLSSIFSARFPIFRGALISERRPQKPFGKHPAHQRRSDRKDGSIRFQDRGDENQDFPTAFDISSLQIKYHKKNDFSSRKRGFDPKIIIAASAVKKPCRRRPDRCVVLPVGDAAK